MPGSVDNVPVKGLVSWGALAAFGVDAAGGLGWIRQVAPNGAWSTWTALGVSVRSAPAAFQNADGHVEVIGVGTDGCLGRIWQDPWTNSSGWSGWVSFELPVGSDPAVFPNQSGHVEVFAAGPDGRLGHVWQLEPNGQTGWSSWDEIGPEIHGVPSAFRNADGRLEVFALDADGRLGHSWQLDGDGVTGWSQWDSFGHLLHTPPTAFQTADGRLEVFAIGSDGCLGHVWQLQPGGMTGWSDWESFGHVLRSPPAVFQNGDGRLEVFAIGDDGRLGHVWQLDPGGTTGWSDWDSFAHVLGGTPTVFPDANGCLDVFARDRGGALGHVWQLDRNAEHGWSDWVSLGVTISERRLSVCHTGAEIEVDLDRLGEVQSRGRSPWPAAAAPVLTADVCVIGAGPAGITVSQDLLAAGASVILLESGSWGEDHEAQELNHGDAYGPVVKDHLKYLRDGRRRQVQGAAAGWHRGWCMPFRTIDFESRSWVPHSGWPIGREELARHEHRAAETLGFEPFETPSSDGALLRLSYHFPRDPNVFRRNFLSMLSRTDFAPELRCTAIGFQLRGDRVESVRVARLAGGELTVRADRIVLAAGAIENARLLLLAEQDLPIPNQMIGRCFMEHPHVRVGTAHMPDRQAIAAFIGDPMQVEVLSLTDSAQREERLLNASVQLRPLGLTGAGATVCELYVRAEQAPNPGSRVTLAEQRDRFGCPLPVLHWNLLEQDWSSVVRTAELIGFVLEKRYNARVDLEVHADAPWPWPAAGPGEASNATWGNHHMGTTRMAAEDAEGVVDSNCRVHGTSNLYVTGSSVFPTGGCANPTFQIVVLAHRLGEHLAAGSRSAGQR